MIEPLEVFCTRRFAQADKVFYTFARPNSVKPEARLVLVFTNDTHCPVYDEGGVYVLELRYQRSPGADWDAFKGEFSRSDAEQLVGKAIRLGGLEP